MIVVSNLGFAISSAVLRCMLHVPVESAVLLLVLLQVRLGGSDCSTLHERLSRRTVMRLCEYSEACACGAESVSEVFSPLGDTQHPARVPWISLDV